MENERLLGELFGYPECCIDYWENLRDTHCGMPWRLLTQERKDLIKRSPFAGVGFIPCPCCLEKKPEDLVSEINAQRHHALTSFPNGSVAKALQIIEEQKLVKNIQIKRSKKRICREKIVF